ncbi:hypothetical protein OROGR_022954 [Orobanche gracilis]
MERGRDMESKGFGVSRNPESAFNADTDAEMNRNLTSGVTFKTDPPSGNLAHGADQTEGGHVNPFQVMQGMMAQMTQMAQIVETLQNSMVQGLPQQGPQVPICRHVGDVSQIVGNISRMRPPTFEGSSEPADIVHWLEHLDKLFDMGQCPEELKVAVAAYYLSKGAYSWWLSMKPTSRDCVWSEFKTLMLGRYHPAPLCEAKLFEILKPKSVEDEGVLVTAEKFYGLLRFASSIIRTEADKIKYFSRRLNPQLRLQLFNHNCSSLSEFIDKALGLELLIKELAQKKPSVSSDRTKMPVRSGEHQDPLSKKLLSSRLRFKKASSSKATGSTGHLQKYCSNPSASKSRASSRASRDSVTSIRTPSKGSCQASRRRGT